jgi:hypothetical protein
LRAKRRFRASLRAGLESIPAIVRELGDEEMLEVALIENLQREDLNSIEEALGYQRLIEELRYTHERVSERVGKEPRFDHECASIAHASGRSAVDGFTWNNVGGTRAGIARIAIERGDRGERALRRGHGIECAQDRSAGRAQAAPQGGGSQGAYVPWDSQSGVDAVSSNYAEWTNELRRRLADARADRRAADRRAGPTSRSSTTTRPTSSGCSKSWGCSDGQ